MAVYIFMSLSIILGIALLLDFFGFFSRSKKDFKLEIGDKTADKRPNTIFVKYTQVKVNEDKTRKAA